MGLVLFAGHDNGLGGHRVAVLVGDDAADFTTVAETSHGHGVVLAGVGKYPFLRSFICFGFILL